MNIWYILLTVVMLSVLIFVHELGHYTAARIFHVPINEFALGMGPKLLSKRSKKTQILYSIRALPIGGFVSMVGEDEDSDDENALNRKPVWQRMIITAAGAVMNLITGVVVMSIVVMLSKGLGSTVIAEFDDDATSVNYGLSVGDEILKVNGKRVYVAGDLSYEIMHSASEPIDLTVRREGEKLVLRDVTFPSEVVDGVAFGMPDFYVMAEEKTPISVIKHTFSRSASAVKMVWDSLIDLVSGKYGIENVSGPVGVATAVTDAAKNGVENFLFLVVVITMNLGVFNLLPFPALDGGRLVFQLVELIRRKPLKPEVEGYIHFGGIVILLLFMVLITFKDIFTLFA